MQRQELSQDTAGCWFNSSLVNRHFISLDYCENNINNCLGEQQKQCSANTTSFFFFFNCTWNVCDEITLYTYSVFEKFHAWPYYFIFLSLIATLGRLLTGIAISKIRPKLSAILICVPVQSPSTCSSVWLRNSQPISHYVHSSSCVGWDKLCFVEACMTFL